MEAAMNTLKSKTIKTLMLAFCLALSSAYLIADDTHTGNVVKFDKIVFTNSQNMTFTSIDGGNTWSKKVDNIATEKKEEKFANQIFVTNKGKQFVSFNYGKTWKEKHTLQGNTGGADTVTPLIVYPNPIGTDAKLSLLFIYPLNSMGDASIKIFNQSNQMLYNGYYKVMSGENSIDIKLTNDFIAGIYYIVMKIDDSTETIYNASFIVQ